MDDNLGFKKIEFDNIEDKKIMEKRSSSSGKLKKAILAVIIMFLIITGISVFVGLKVKKIYKNSQIVYSQARLAYDAMKQQNIILAKDELVKTNNEISNLKKSVGELSFLSYIPLLNLYYNDGNHLINASSYAVSAGISVCDSLIPYVDVLGLKGDKSFVSGSAEDRVQTAVKTLGKIVPDIDAIEANLSKAKTEIDAVDLNRYPNISQLKDLKLRLTTVKSLADEGIVAIQQAKPLIKVIPDLLGEPNSKKYLVLFQNDKELRSTGGFLTFYSVFRVEHGVIKVDSASDIYALDSSIANHPKAPEIILKYLPKVYTLNIRDSNLSPDYVTSMDIFNNMYLKSSLHTKIDGIIAIDTNVLVHFLDILGDVQASGITFSSKPDPRCDSGCSQVVYELESFTTTQVGHVIENRKAIIGELLFAIMKKSLSSSPKLYWGRLFQQAITDAQEKHILIYLFDKNAQSGVEALNLAGRIKNFDGDYLAINENNYGGAKSNMFINQSVKVEYTVTSDRKISKTITIDYKNPYKASNCNLEQKEVLCLNAILRDYVRLYVPKGSIVTDSKGSEVKVTSSEDLGKTMIEGFLTVRPESKSQLIISYSLPFKLENGSSLPFLIQKQPGTTGIPYEIYVNGKKQDSFVLNQDKILNLSGL